MSQVEAGVFGYISGLVVGSLLLIFAIGWFYYKQPDSGSPPEWYMDVYRDMKLLHETHQTTFTLLFILGLLSGMGGSGTAVNSQRNRNNN